MAGTSEPSKDDYLLGQKAAESERLDALTKEVCQWLSNTLNVEITYENYMEKLETGVELCKLQNELCPLLGGQEIEYHDDAEKHPQFSQENIEHFVKWCKDLQCHQLFEPNDLVIRKSKLNENKEQADQNMQGRRRRVILCLLQVKQKHDRIMPNKRGAEASEGDKNEKVTVTMADETDSNHIVITTQAQVTDPNQSDATQSSDMPPESECKDEVKEPKVTSDTQDTAPNIGNESKSPPTMAGSNESLENERGVTTKPTTTTQVAPNDSHTSNAPLLTRGYFYPALFLCILPLLFLGGFYFLKRRK